VPNKYPQKNMAVVWLGGVLSGVLFACL